MKRNGTKLVPGFIFVGAVLIAACARPYHEEKRTLRVRGHEH